MIKYNKISTSGVSYMVMSTKLATYEMTRKIIIIRSYGNERALQSCPKNTKQKILRFA
jgi:hypothetical protein